MQAEVRSSYHGEVGSQVIILQLLARIVGRDWHER